MAVKGNLHLEIDEQGIEVRITIVPDENGAEITIEGITNLLTDKKVRSGIDTEAMDRAIRTLARKKQDPVSFVAAAGVAPQAGTPEAISFPPWPIPERLAAAAKRVLETAPPAQGFRLREERIKTERKVLKKSPLPFLPPREEIEVQVEKRLLRDEVRIDPTVTGQGFVRRGGVVAKFTPGTQGKEGKSVFGRLVQAPRPDAGDKFLLLDGLSRAGSEVKAQRSGFLRRGVNWADVVPFQDHSLEIAAAPDGMTCLLTFRPGDEGAPPPDLGDLLLRASHLGFAADSLLPRHEIETMLQDSILRGTPIESAPLTPTSNGLALVTVSEDKMKAVLFLRKGRGGGKPLTAAAVSEAIRASKVRGFAAEAVRKDLLAFFSGKAAELADCVLVTGRAAKPGSEPKIEWRTTFLPAAEAAAVRASAEASPAVLESLPSREEFPLSRVESVARVKRDAEVVHVTPSAGGEPGVDVYGTVLSAARPVTELRLFEGLVMRQSAVVVQEDGILEKGSDGKTVLLRVRPHRDAELSVTVSPDAMRASVSFSPAQGLGTRISAEEFRQRLEQAGVRKGIDEKRLAALLARAAREEPFTDETVAEGRAAHQDAQSRVAFHVALASGKAVSLRRDGSADFRAQDRITRVQAGQKVATVRPRDAQSEDGWDVAGRTITPPASAQQVLKAGRGVREQPQSDGTVLFVAQATGELMRDGPVISVTEAHTISGDVSMSTGNVSFSGIVRVGGSVLSGFTVVAGGVLEVGGAVGAALLSADGTITVGQGIKGAGRAILRSKRDIQAVFAEQAVLLAIGDIHLRGACLHCQVKCNGRLRLDSEKGSLLGGEVRASRGVEAHNIGSPGGVRTVVSFGQDYLVRDQIEREEREVARLVKSVADLDAELFVLEKSVGAAPAGARASSPAAAMLARVRAQKVQTMKLIETRKMRLITLRDRYDEHIPSDVIVRGTLFPGAVLESHGRRYETHAEKKLITLHFDPVRGAIVEKV